VRVFFDSSVLIAAVSVQHMHHGPSLAAYLAARKEPGKLRGSQPGRSLRYAHQAARQTTNELRADPTFSRRDQGSAQDHCTQYRSYPSAIARAAAEGIVGGSIYDALIARCAVKARAEIIFTWNIDHFRRLGPEVAKRVRTPYEAG
jgi:hypothetical protein